MSDVIKFNKFVSKGWGYEKIIVNGPLYCGKILHFVKGRSCSLHYHKIKEETFFVSFGKIVVNYVDDYKEAEARKKSSGSSSLWDICSEVVLEKGDYFHIKPGLVHKMTALEDSEIIEFSTTDYSDDSYRLIKGD